MWAAKQRIPIVFLAGLTLIAVFAAVLLSASPLTLARSNAIPAEDLVTIFHGPARVCQQDSKLPSGTSALRLSIIMAVGGQLSAEALAGSRVLTHGAIAAGWRGSVVTIPVARVAREVAPVEVCVTLTPTSEPAGLLGKRTPAGTGATLNGQPIPGRMRIEYLRTGSRTWWSLALSTARRMGLGRAWAGSAIALLAGSLLAATILASGLLVTRRL